STSVRSAIRHLGRPPMSRDPRDFVTNLHAPMPFSRKVYLVLRNNWIKIRTGSTCCGHPGEPGC
ncbi:MAG TPA: hypothetical protein VFD74_00470, partial [Thermoleophilia bacterium]|nr:hypothetical protein [Thermoleophilia bacterium]